VHVEESAQGVPVALKDKRRQPVAAIEAIWRLDDEWWRTEALSRMYFAVMLASGHRLVLFKNLLTNCWYRQSY